MQQLASDNASQQLRHLTYVDQAPEMVNAARAAAATQIIGVAFEAAVADEEFLPFADASHDCALPVSCGMQAVHILVQPSACRYS